MNHSYVSVVYCFDKNYVDNTVVSSYSVFKNCKSPVKFYWLCSHYAVLHANFYRRALSKLGMNIDIIAVDTDNFKTWKEDQIVPHITETAYVRLLIPDLVNENRVIYLDSDIIVVGNIAELYNIDLYNYTMAGVGNFLDPMDSHIQAPIIDQSVVYINSGVLVMNLDYLRKDNFIFKAKHIHDTYYDLILAGDQCIINKYLDNNKLLLPREWNWLVKSMRMSDHEFRQLVANNQVKIIHFTDSIKPWHLLSKNRAMRDFWFLYVEDLRNNLKAIGSEIH